MKRPYWQAVRRRGSLSCFHICSSSRSPLLPVRLRLYCYRRVTCESRGTSRLLSVYSYNRWTLPIW